VLMSSRAPVEPSLFDCRVPSDNFHAAASSPHACERNAVRLLMAFEISSSVDPAIHERIDDAYPVFEGLMTLRICLIFAVIGEVQGDTCVGKRRS